MLTCTNWYFLSSDSPNVENKSDVETRQASRSEQAEVEQLLSLIASAQGTEGGDGRADHVRQQQEEEEEDYSHLPPC